MSNEASAVLWAFGGASLVVLLTRLQRRLWDRGYWGLGELLTGFEYGDRPGRRAIFVKVGIPMASGLVAAIGTSQSELVVGASVAGFGALALVWPVFDSVEAIPPYALSRVSELRLLYAMFVGAYALLGGVGAFLAILVKGVASDPGLGPFLADRALNLLDGVIWSLVAGTAAAGYLRWANRHTYQIKDEGTQATVGPYSFDELAEQPDVETAQEDEDDRRFQAD